MGGIVQTRRLLISQSILSEFQTLHAYLKTRCRSLIIGGLDNFEDLFSKLLVSCFILLPSFIKSFVSKQFRNSANPQNRVIYFLSFACHLEQWRGEDQRNEKMRQLLQRFPRVYILHGRSHVSDDRLCHPRWLHLQLPGSATRATDQRSDGRDTTKTRPRTLESDGKHEHSTPGELVCKGASHPRRIHDRCLYFREAERLGMERWRWPGSTMDVRRVSPLLHHSGHDHR